MQTTTNIRILEKKGVQESLLAFTFDVSGIPKMVDECNSLKDSLALLGFAQEAIKKRLQQLTEEIIKNERHAA